MTMRGRPKSSDPKKNSYVVHMTDDDMAKLVYISKVLNFKKSDFFRHSIYYFYKKFKEEQDGGDEA